LVLVIAFLVGARLQVVNGVGEWPSAHAPLLPGARILQLRVLNELVSTTDLHRLHGLLHGTDDCDRMTLANRRSRFSARARARMFGPGSYSGSSSSTRRRSMMTSYWSSSTGMGLGLGQNLSRVNSSTSTPLRGQGWGPVRTETLPPALRMAAG